MTLTTTYRGQQGGGPSTPPKFLTIILDPHADTQKISDKWCRRYGQDLPTHVFLRVGGVCVSKVGLLRRNGKTFLSEGWKEFKRCYSLNSGSLLVFEYDGASEFNVCRFGLSGTEISYPFDRVPNLGSALSCTCGKVKLQPQSSSEEQETSTAKKARTPYEKAESYTRAHTSSLNPSFITEMRPSYIKGHTMHMSASFGRKYLPPTKSNLTLRLSDGKTWPVKYSMVKCSTSIYSGWRPFVRDNGLNVGDACLFEVANQAERVWNVIIFRK